MCLAQGHKAMLPVRQSSAGDHCKQFGPRPGRQNIGPDLDPNCLTLLIVFLKFFL